MDEHATALPASWPSPEVLEKIGEAMAEHRATVEQAKEGRLAVSVLRRMLRQQLHDPRLYLRTLRHSARERRTLAEEISGQQALRSLHHPCLEELLRKLDRYLPNPKPMRLWIVGVSEPALAYVVALLPELLLDRDHQHEAVDPQGRVQLVATDRAGKNLADTPPPADQTVLEFLLPHPLIKRRFDCRRERCMPDAQVRERLERGMDAERIRQEQQRFDAIVVMDPEHERIDWQQHLAEGGLLWPKLASIDTHGPTGPPDPMHLEVLRLLAEGEERDHGYQTLHQDWLRITHLFATLIRRTPRAVLLFDAHQRLMAFNPPTTRWFDLVADDVGRPLEHLISRLPHQHLMTLTDLARKTRTEQQASVPVGSNVALHLYATPVFLDSGGLAGVFIEMEQQL